MKKIKIFFGLVLIKILKMFLGIKSIIVQNGQKSLKKINFYIEDKIQYCTRCCLPETMEGITFDEFGVCTPCRSSEEKMHINWKDKQS